MRFRNIAVAAAALLAASSAALYGAGPAAADVIGTKRVSSNCDWDDCGDGRLYLQYNAVSNSGHENPSGSMVEFYGDIYNHGYDDVPTRGTNVFIRYIYVFESGQGAGSGQTVKNNAESANNCSTSDGYRVYYNSGYAGHSQYISHAYGCSASYNLDSTLKNNNASSHFA
ncbi:hypothetical protein RKE30_26375 [Streptomyces sp. Li-HN-5-11]|uniref:hypothetical protein n=1 Tax=Streptomyces sp. Li-HN-5-11 TaxID=3075432 RepID=UPI0028B25B4C|nr:hypothetical protein [Streptomyces sp. Li-HN-5-11]WNM33663.1 hypothetical protein RKE30_26375 [Streptomyces sp. Li-HN-5-11]